MAKDDPRFRKAPKDRHPKAKPWARLSAEAQDDLNDRRRANRERARIHTTALAEFRALPKKGLPSTELLSRLPSRCPGCGYGWPTPDRFKSLTAADLRRLGGTQSA